MAAPKPIDFSDPMTYAMMAGLSIPEQATLFFLAPQLPLMQRLSVSGAMFAIHFGTNGFVNRAPSLAMEMPWILGTAAYATYLSGQTNVGLTMAAADLAMTVFMRSR